MTTTEQRPALVSAEAWQPPPVRVRTARNGIPVYQIPMPGRELATVHIAVAPGGACEPADRDGIAALLAAGCAMGPARRLEATFVDELERHGATLTGGADHDGSYLTAVVPGHRLPALLDLLAPALARPALDERWIRSAVARRAAASRTESLHPVHRPADTIRRLSYAAGSPYARTARGDAASLSDVDHELLRDLHGRWYGPATTSVIIAGDLDRWRVADRVVDTFGAWDRPVPPAAPPPATPASQPKWEVHAAEGARQAVLVLGAAVHCPDLWRLAGLEAAVHALAGWSPSRLNTALREEMACSYGFHSEFVARRTASGYLAEFRVYGAVDTDRLPAATARLLAECTDLAERGPAVEESRACIANLAALVPMLAQSVREVVEQTAIGLRRGFALDEIAERAPVMAGLPPAAVREAAHALAPRRLNLALIGDPAGGVAALEPLAAALGIPVVRAGGEPAVS
ncbi:M16 family metallopeptidase [Phytohabitans kaempferiae]|uniref:M16 family metallopeptidase n=1 Tax=Phytohabitans kaempferiae TaxID=1620943 RepID=A0ABV6M543_9ACTN